MVGEWCLSKENEGLVTPTEAHNYLEAPRLFSLAHKADAHSHVISRLRKKKDHPYFRESSLTTLRIVRTAGKKLRVELRSIIALVYDYPANSTGSLLIKKA